MPDRVPSEGRTDSKIMIVGMGPARDEMIHGRPFMGPAGEELNRAMGEIGLKRTDCYLTNISDEFLPPEKSLFSLPYSEIQRHLSRLTAEILTVKPNVIISLGAEPLKYLTGKDAVTSWRGSILPCTLVPDIKVVATVHPAWIIRGMWKWHAVFAHIDLKRGMEESKFPEINYPERKAITGPSLSTSLDYIDLVEKEGICSKDIEVYGYTDHGMGEIACIGIGYKPSEALCIPITKGGGIPYWSEVEECKIWLALARLFQNSRVKKVGQNLSFEWMHFWYHDIFPGGLWRDTMTQHHCLYPDFGGTSTIWDSERGRKKKFDEPGHGLAFINSQYTRTPYYKDDGRRWSPALGDHAFWVYNATDVMVTIECAFKMNDELKDERLTDFYEEFYIQPFLPAARMEWVGVGVDIAKRRMASIEMGKEIVRIQEEINNSLGYVLNVNSPKQMHDFLYKDRGYQVKKNRKTGKPTADKETLSYFAMKHNDMILQEIERLRMLRDLKADLLDQPLGPDGRMHTHYNLGGADSNRWTSMKSILGTGTNLQNLPRKGIAKELFIP